MELALLPICAAFGAFFIWLVLRLINQPEREFFDVLLTVTAPIGLLLIGVVAAWIFAILH